MLIKFILPVRLWTIDEYGSKIRYYKINQEIAMEVFYELYYNEGRQGFVFRLKTLDCDILNREPYEDLTIPLGSNKWKAVTDFNEAQTLIKDIIIESFNKSPKYKNITNRDIVVDYDDTVNDRIVYRVETALIQ